MAILKRDEILGAQDILPPVEVQVPEWGGSVLVKQLSGAERDAYDTELSKLGKDKYGVNLRARYLSHVVVDESGKRMFSDADIAALGSKSAAAIGRVWDKASEINGLVADEELEKNSEVGQSA
jgi:hypothetical protein